MLLSDLEIYVDGVEKGFMFKARLVLHNKLFSLGMPLSVVNQTLFTITFDAPDVEFKTVERIAKALFKLYNVTKPYGIETYFHELNRIKHIQ